MDKHRTLDPIAVGIKKVIRKKGLLQKVVAKRAGFSERQFSDMLNGRKIIKACDLFPISKAIGVCISEICSAAQNMNGG